MNRTARTTVLILAAAAFVAVTVGGVARANRGATGGAATSAGTHDQVVATRITTVSRARRSGGAFVFLSRLIPALAADTTSATAPVAAPAADPAVRARVVLHTAPSRSGATPRSVQVLRVPVPVEVPGKHTVRWTVRPDPRAEVLSASDGVIPASAPNSSRAITVVTRVPARAAAGVLPVGEVEFQADTVAVIVPIELVIDRVRRASISAARPSFGAISGQPLTLSVEVRNLGNAPDTISLKGDVPAGWSSVREQQVVLNPGERRVVNLTTKVPFASGTTAAYPSVRVLLGDSVVAEASLPVQVDDPSERHHAVGPQLTIGSSTAFGDSVASSPAFDFGLLGMITNSVSISGRSTYIVNEATVDRRALYRAGAYLGGTFLNIRGPGWYASLGNTGTTISTLTGIGAFGKGVLASGNRGPVSGTALVAAVPLGSGVQVGGRADYQFTKASLGLAGSHFQDDGPAQRALDAAGLVGTWLPGAGFKLSAEAAARRFTGGQGTGVAVGVDRVTPKDLLSAQYSHSPGGSQAYGRALNEFSGVWGRRFGERIALQSNLFSSLDRPPVTGGEFISNGWSVSPRYALTPDLAADIEVRRTHFNSKNPTGGAFGSTELTTYADLRKVGGRWQWNAGTSVGSTERTTVLASGTSVAISAQRIGFNAGGAVILPRAVVSAGADYSTSGAGSGLAPRQARLVLGASRVRIFSGVHAPLFRANLELTSWLGDRPSAVVARIGSEIPLPSQFSLVIDAERNPMIRATTGHTPWIVAMRLERGFTLGWASHVATTRGSVFEDRNANGIRDAGEAGLPGVMIRRGSQSAVTDGQGRFILPGKDAAQVEVDPVSLPAGAVAPSISAGAPTGAVIFGVVPTGSINVKLIPAVDELGRRPESKLADLAVIARDDRGAEWYLRADSTGAIRFDALPPGRYTFVPDFAGTTERLRQIGDPVIFEVKPGDNPPPLEIKFAPRAARVFNGGSSATDQGRRRR